MQLPDDLLLFKMAEEEIRKNDKMQYVIDGRGRGGRIFDTGIDYDGLGLNLPMLRLLSSKAQARTDFWKPSKPGHVEMYSLEISR